MSDLSSAALYAIGDILEEITHEYADSRYADAIAPCDRVEAARELVERLAARGLEVVHIAAAPDEVTVMIGEQRVALAAF